MKEIFLALVFILTKDLFNRRKVGHEPREPGNEPRLGDRRKLGLREAQKRGLESIDRLNDVIDKTIGGK